MGGVFQLFWEGAGISRDWATAHFLILMVCLGTVMAPVGMSFSLLTCYNECILKFKVWSTCPPSWTHLVLIRLCLVLGLCHFFKGCALPPSLLFPIRVLMGLGPGCVGLSPNVSCTVSGGWS